MNKVNRRKIKKTVSILILFFCMGYTEFGNYKYAENLSRKGKIM